SVSGGSAQCITTITVAGSHAFLATFSGTVTDAGSPSNTLNVTASTHTFTGPGSYSTASLWSASTLPANSEDAIINGACSIDGIDTANLNTMTLADGASVTLVGGNNTIAGLWAARVVGTGQGTLDLGNTGVSTPNSLLLLGSGTV